MRGWFYVHTDALRDTSIIQQWTPLWAPANLIFLSQNSPLVFHQRHFWLNILNCWQVGHWQSKWVHEKREESDDLSIYKPSFHPFSSVSCKIFPHGSITRSLRVDHTKCHLYIIHTEYWLFPPYRDGIYSTYYHFYRNMDKSSRQSILIAFSGQAGSQKHIRILSNRTRATLQVLLSFFPKMVSVLLSDALLKCSFFSSS